MKIDGERNPAEVYEDVHKTCEYILGAKLASVPNAAARPGTLGVVDESDALISSLGSGRQGSTGWIGPVVFVVGSYAVLQLECFRKG
jgi:hypothetical protein